MFLDLISRDLRSRFIGSYTGWLWLLINPLLLLGVYAFVFGVIFKARVPENMEVSFVVWLALGLWPWLAFSEGIVSASESMPRYKNLISKVAVPREILALSTATASFVLQMVGFVVVLVLISLLGVTIHWSGLIHAASILTTLFILSCGIGLFAAALRVYIPDIEQLLPTMLMFGFFLTPIIYAPEMLPEAFGVWLDLNPMAGLLTDLRGALLVGDAFPSLATGVFAAISALIFLLGMMFFRRMSPFFEDFL